MIAAKTISCPNCGGSLDVRAAGYTVSLACRYCGALIDIAHPEARVISQYHEAVAQLPLPLGSRGTLFGVEWEAIGWQERQTSDTVWSETLLFNPYAGYRWLVHFGGHWQFGTMLTGTPQSHSDGSVIWRGQEWTLDDARVSAVTNRVLGEFYWRVHAGERVDTAEYVHGNDTLSLERTADEINWTHLVTLRPRDVLGSFRHGPDDPDEAPETPAPAGNWRARWADMPFYGENDAAMMLWTALVAIVIVLTGMMTFGTVTAAISSRMTVQIDGPATQATIGTLTIDRASQRVELTAQTYPGFVNTWVDCDYALVDKRTQQAIRADGTVEFYAGRDTDGSTWTEGSHHTTLDISNVPRGTYDVIVQAQGHHWTDPKAIAPVATNGWEGISNGASEVTFVVSAGGVDWGMFFTIMALLITPPLVLMYWQFKQRQNA
ncbi:DUF4178 domain-containing protein [Novosphingobium sp.]|uniref:DUF4178 domain-containing protein n=1 Tax=Novosphingobium sp. TaxID=1874826 RepID=UPI003D0D1DB4